MVDFDFSETRKELEECHELVLEHLTLVETLMARNLLAGEQVEKQLANARQTLAIYRRTASALALDVANLTAAQFDFERSLPEDYDAV